MIRRRDFLAAWWLSSLPRAVPLAGSGLLAGCAHLLEEDGEAHNDALETQQEEGWNVGSEGHGLAFPHAVDTDVDGGTSWRGAFGTLALQLAPRDPHWFGYYDPTLFQVLASPGSGDLQLMMRPISSPLMGAVFARGQSLLSLFAGEDGCRNDVALVIDLPGPQSVALAAALVSCFEPVFMFDNWPHPAGVVPAHLTLAAALFFLPMFTRGRAAALTGSAPAFVLDRNRLAHYSDEADAFDNRYVAGLPPHHVLAAAGIRHILYVTSDDQPVFYDADDLNDDLVDIDRGGIDIKVLAMSDFAREPLPGWVDEHEPEPQPAPDAGVADGGVADGGAADGGVADGGAAYAGAVHARLPFHRPFYFGGSRRAHDCFWAWYGWPRSPGAFTGRVVPGVPRTLIPRSSFRPMRRSVFSPRFRGSSRGHSRGWWGRGGSRGRTHWGGFSG